MKYFIILSMLLLILSRVSIQADNSINYIKPYANLANESSSCRIPGDSILGGFDSAAKGLYIFRRTCSPCHGIDKVVSGPALNGLTNRGPWISRSNIHKWVRNPVAFIPTTQYTRDLQKKFGSIMPCFNFPDSTIDYIVAFIKRESNKKPNDPSRYDLQPGVTVLEQTKKSIIYRWPDGIDTVYLAPDTTNIDYTEYHTQWFDTTDKFRIEDPNVEQHNEFQLLAQDWQNVDALLKNLPGLKKSHLNVIPELPGIKLRLSCHFLLPSKKIMITNYDFENDRFYFETGPDRKIPVYQNEQALVIVVGGSGDETYYGIKAFTTSDKMDLSVKLIGPVSEQEFRKAINSLNIKAIEIF